MLQSQRNNPPARREAQAPVKGFSLTDDARVLSVMRPGREYTVDDLIHAMRRAGHCMDRNAVHLSCKRLYRAGLIQRDVIDKEGKIRVFGRPQ